MIAGVIRRQLKLINIDPYANAFNVAPTGAQLASDLGKGLIQGTSQYIAKKMRTVKVHLKAGYRVMLYQEKD